MARVPTWTELRLDATKLAQLQKECYRSVHDLLDRAIPELDSKLSLLYDRHSSKTQLNPIKATQTSYYDEPFLTMHEDGDHHHTIMVQDDPSMPELEQRLSALNTSPAHKPNNSERSKTISFEAFPKQQKKKLILKKSQANNTNNGSQKKVAQPRKVTKRELEEFEHLKPLPMPLCEYLKLNRPGVVSRANQRVIYLRRKAERRKQLNSTRILRTTNRIKIQRQSSKSSIRTSDSNMRDNVVPDYQIKYKLSEHEMKRLTARIYKRLPEVERQRSDEVSKHMRIQNYKNKMEYGRKLLENRRQGIINYPLKSNNDDSSLMSSQDDSLLSSGQSTDAFRLDTYY